MSSRTKDYHNRFGPLVSGDAVTFRMWAPNVERVRLKIDDRKLIMDRLRQGWHQLTVEGAGPGTRYSFVFPDGQEVPDPASRYQPDDVHGPSEVIDHKTYQWSDETWQGLPWEEAIIYELHLGTFTPEGTFSAAIGKLDHLVSLGITVVEIMPVADFPGERNWGYDGVLLFACDAAYGRPDDFKAFVDAAHVRGIMVFLDVVYNHFGPDGNYLSTYAPVFTDNHHTPWGAAVNFDADDSVFVREFIVENALAWINDFHLDGLRLDAVHAIKDNSSEHILKELARRVRFHVDRRVHIILENEENEETKLSRDELGLPLFYNAQWNDDFHHVLHALITGETSGYYQDYFEEPAKLARVLADGFAYQGEVMGFRGTPRGQPSAGLPATSFVSFLQNHDQIGNRAFGDRIHKLASPEAIRAASAIYLLSPHIPMLFMGEEWGTEKPFVFFCDVAKDLQEPVREGRRKEFAKFPEFSDAQHLRDIPDPTSPSTFELAVLDWNEIENAEHSSWLTHYRALIAVRRNEVTRHLYGLEGYSGHAEMLGPKQVQARWQFADGSKLHVLANMDDAPFPAPPMPPGKTIWREGEFSQKEIGGWSVVWTIEQPLPTPET